MYKLFSANTTNKSDGTADEKVPLLAKAEPEQAQQPATLAQQVALLSSVFNIQTLDKTRHTVAEYIANYGNIISMLSTKLELCPDSTTLKEALASEQENLANLTEYRDAGVIDDTDTYADAVVKMTAHNDKCDAENARNALNQAPSPEFAAPAIAAY